MKNYHEILGLERDASPEAIKARYRELAKKYHPDLNKSPNAQERFIEITEAYEVLISPKLQRGFQHTHDIFDENDIRSAREKASRAARESAHRYARMKYEKFVEEQEAFKRSGWYDTVLFLHYAFRILVFPLFFLFAALPLVNSEVSSDVSGYVAFWILALLLLFYFLNNRKGYFRLGKFYYSLSHLTSLFTEASTHPTADCYYCKGKKANALPVKITLFRIIKIELMSFYGVAGQQRTGMKRKTRDIRIPRSRKALVIHSILPFFKIGTVVVFVLSLRHGPLRDYAIFLGLPAGGLLSSCLLLATGTKSKASYLLSYGMLIKLLFWVLAILFFNKRALLLVFFDPLIEASLRFISDGLFRPMLRQYKPLEVLFEHDYQLYLELPVWSALVPFFRWLF